MDGGAWWAAVHGVAKSWTRLIDFTFTFHFPALEKEMATHPSILAWRIPGTGETRGLPSMGSHRVGHDWSDLAAAAAAAAAAEYTMRIILLLNTNSCAWCTVRPNQGDGVWSRERFIAGLSKKNGRLVAKEPWTPQSFWQSVLKGEHFSEVREGLPRICDQLVHNSLTRVR